MGWVFLFSMALLGLCESQSSNSSSSSSSSSIVISSSNSSASSSLPSSSDSSGSGSSSLSSSDSSGSGSSSLSSSDSSGSGSSSLPSSSSSSLCMAYADCSSCFNNANCSWDFPTGSCMASNGTTMLPFPLDFLHSNSTFCAFEQCLKDINPADKQYESLFTNWLSANRDTIASVAQCALAGVDACDGTKWNNTDYVNGCGKVPSAELCEFSTTATWTTDAIFVSSSSSSSSLSNSSTSAMSSSSSSTMSNSSTSAMSSSSSSSAMSSSSASSMSSSGSSAMSSSGSSAMSSSASSAMSSSSGPPGLTLMQSYCVPSTCPDLMKDYFVEIWTNMLQVPKPTSGGAGSFQCGPAPTNKPSSLSGGAIAGIVIGCLVGVLLLGFLGWNVCGKQRDSNEFQAM